MPAATPPPDLPEPSELHARLSAGRELDWGDPLPTSAEISAAYGPDAAAQSLELLARAAEVEPAISGEMIEAIEAEGFTAYRLKNRMKSPQSLARKIRVTTAFQFDRAGQPLDVMRYTILVDQPHQVVGAAERTVERLSRLGWSMHSAHHSYVDDSRYKGLHLYLHSHGQAVEVHVHSRESIEVKERTTRLYEIERDRDQPRAARDAARAECVGLSATMVQPAGIDDLKVLGGVPVDRRRYGGGKSRPTDSAKGGRRSDDGGRQSGRSRPARERGNDEGMTR
jgi:predicted RNA binding protein YcfA (HicA-like mRNA interferase family)